MKRKEYKNNQVHDANAEADANEPTPKVQTQLTSWVRAKYNRAQCTELLTATAAYYGLTDSQTEGVCNLLREAYDRDHPVIRRVSKGFAALYVRDLETLNKEAARCFGCGVEGATLFKSYIVAVVTAPGGWWVLPHWVGDGQTVDTAVMTTVTSWWWTARRTTRIE